MLNIIGQGSTWRGMAELDVTQQGKARQGFYKSWTCKTFLHVGTKFISTFMHDCP